MVPDAILDSTAHLSWSTDMSLEILHHSHGLLTTLRVMQLHPGPELPWQDAQELLQHQQLQDLSLGACFWPQPPATELPEPAQRLLGSRCLVVTQLSKMQVGGLPNRGAAPLEAGSPFPDIVLPFNKTLLSQSIVGPIFSCHCCHLRKDPLQGPSILA